ncbi:DTW domain-containing protein [Gilbertella persicaria]|uniref:DTW domain-containing protein n=1 Tax=Gilbertella persicaria TaxID=101096 RepID=UPI00221FF602|nr:DTW domain-containing protein [Gilbertella persicaria]KAI8060396.1 DTW domain-containing protein [Gilbertella persicaria]
MYLLFFFFLSTHESRGYHDSQLSDIKRLRHTIENKKRNIDQVDLEGPFDLLKIDNDQVLKNISTRSLCPTCNKTVKYFCYKCHKVVGMKESDIPCVRLPVHLDIIKHHKELDGKSTAVHAKIVAKQDADLHTWPDIPQFEHPERTLLLFPSPDAKQLKDIPRDSFDRIAVIDGTWIQAKQIANNTPILKKMQCVTIAPQKTHFWRFQNVDDQHLATIEAIYYLYREYSETYEDPYDGKYDNLLFYYKFFYNMIQHRYQTIKKTATFTHRHQQKDYIKTRNKN